MKEANIMCHTKVNDKGECELCYTLQELVAAIASCEPVANIIYNPMELEALDRVPRGVSYDDIQNCERIRLAIGAAERALGY